MLFKNNKKLETMRSLTNQQIENANTIEDLMRASYDLMGTSAEFTKEIFDIVESQQKAIRNLQNSILSFEKISKEGS